MIRQLGIGLGCAVVGYLAGAFGGGYLISVLSTNRHDRSVEAAMTGAFVTGPLVAILAIVCGLIWFRK